jgi:4-hydroxy-4-methyl-2-oxoglutarate aldolase
MTIGVGHFVPASVLQPAAPPPEPALVSALLATSGLTAAVSDALDERGLLTACASEAVPLVDGSKLVGRTITLRYLPLRERGPLPRDRMAHRTLFGQAQRKDVALIVGPASSRASLLGGEAAAAAKDAGLAGCLVGGAVRDVDEIVELGFPVWSLARTPMTGRHRLEAVEINGPVEYGGVQVVAGDVAVADQSGIVFIPSDRFEEIARAILKR